MTINLLNSETNQANDQSSSEPISRFRRVFSSACVNSLSQIATNCISALSGGRTNRAAVVPVDTDEEEIYVNVSRETDVVVTSSGETAPRVDIVRSAKITIIPLDARTTNIHRTGLKILTPVEAVARFNEVTPITEDDLVIEEIESVHSESPRIFSADIWDEWNRIANSHSTYTISITDSVN